MSQDLTFDHLIITRYNLSVPWGRRGRLHADERWLEERQRLFERYCLPSVVQAERSCPSVTWVLMCAADSPTSLRTYMAKIARLHPWIIPTYLEEDFLISDVVDSSLKQVTGKPSHFLLTTRLDSDDAIGQNFVDDLRLETEKSLELNLLGKIEFPSLINFPFGWQTVQGRLYLSADLGSPFLSFLEERFENAPAVTCYLGTHREMHGSAKTVRQLVTSGPSWLQVIHGSNEANVVCGLRLPRHIKSKRFSILGVEKSSENRAGAIKEAARAFRNQIVQSGAYGWKRARVRMDQSRVRTHE